MTTKSLLSLSAKHGHLRMKPLKDSKIGSISFLLPSGTCAWSVDPVGLTAKEYRDKASHEIGHCEKLAFYTVLSAPTCREKCEEAARRWQYEKMIPFKELMRLLHSGVTTSWELSEHFEMPEQIVIDAVNYYRMKNGSNFEYEVVKKWFA